MILTYTGKNLNPFSMQKSDICIEDIAHGLACINRFNGAARIPHSVAQHSVFVKKLLNNTPYALQGLLHDASEAYIGDVTKWLKQTYVFDLYRILERQIQRDIYRRFGCDIVESHEIKGADKLMVRYEASCSFGVAHPIPDKNYPPPTVDERNLVGNWYPWPWDAAERIFLEEFKELTTVLVEDPFGEIKPIISSG